MTINKDNSNSISRLINAIDTIYHANKTIKELTYEEDLEMINSLLLDQFISHILPSHEATSSFTLDYLYGALRYLNSKEIELDWYFNRCLYFALLKEDCGLIGAEINDLIHEKKTESIGEIFNGSKTPQESSIIISYLCVFIKCLQDTAVEIIKKNNDSNIIRTAAHYKEQAKDAQNIIIRGLANNHSDYRIEQNLKGELSLKYKLIPSKSTRKNWINVIKKHLKEINDKQ
ncbi:hypothetical protein KQM04_002051 [Escherichia coli]|nr:hypothetical protein [Escherichia coli]